LKVARYQFKLQIKNLKMEIKKTFLLQMKEMKKTMEIKTIKEIKEIKEILKLIMKFLKEKILMTKMKK
jgi:hypothetical protein